MGQFLLFVFFLEKKIMLKYLIALLKKLLYYTITNETRDFYALLGLGG